MQSARQMQQNWSKIFIRFVSTKVTSSIKFERVIYVWLLAGYSADATRDGHLLLQSNFEYFSPFQKSTSSPSHTIFAWLGLALLNIIL